VPVRFLVKKKLSYSNRLGKFAEIARRSPQVFVG
jgi:hypothetical protein